MTPQAVSARVEVSDGSLFYEVAGVGTAVVLISGGSMLDRRGWDEQFVALARAYRPVRYDVRGLGASSVPLTPFSHTDDLATLLDVLSIEAAVLVGHSFAGGLAIDFCLEHPSRVIAVVAETPALGGFDYSAAFKGRVGRIFAAYRSGGAEAAAGAVLADPFLAPRNAGARERLRAIVMGNIDRLFGADPALARSPEPPAIERLEDFGRPLLVVAAEHDDDDNRAVADLLEQRVANARSVNLSGVGHNAHLDAPEQFNEVLLDFVREVTAC